MNSKKSGIIKRRKEDSTANRFITTMACKVLLRSNYFLYGSNKVNHGFNMILSYTST